MDKNNTMELNNNDLRQAVAQLNSKGINTKIIDLLICSKILTKTQEGKTTFIARDNKYNLVDIKESFLDIIQTKNSKLSSMVGLDRIFTLRFFKIFVYSFSYFCI